MGGAGAGARASWRVVTLSLCVCVWRVTGNVVLSSQMVVILTE